MQASPFARSDSASFSEYVPGKIKRVGPMLGGSGSQRSPSPAAARVSPELLRKASLSPSCLPPIAASRSVSGPERQAARTSVANRLTRSSTLTPSMAQIADQDRVIECRGNKPSPSFELGGRHGNVVCITRINTVHKGWRVVAVDGRRLQPGELAAALRAAQQRPRYTVAFRIGDPVDPEDDSDAKAALERAAKEAWEAAKRAEEEAKEREEAERRRLAAEEAARMAAKEKELAEKRRRASEEAARRAAQDEAEKRRRAEEEEAARRAAEEEERRHKAEMEEAERRRLAAEDLERKRRQEEEAEAARRVSLEEAERKRKAEEEEAARRVAEEDEKKQKAEAEEAERRRLVAEEAEHRRKQEEEDAEAARRIAQEEAERKRKADAEEAARRAAEEEHMRRLEAEETERRRIAAEDAARIRKIEEGQAEAARKAAQEEAERKRKADEEEAARRAAEQEEERKRQHEAQAAERKRLEAEQAERNRQKEEAEAARRAAHKEAELKRKVEKEEIARKAAEERDRRLKAEAAEAEARRLAAAEAEAARRAAQEAAEQKRRAAEEEARRIAAEEERKRRAEAEEAQRQEAELRVQRVDVEKRLQQAVGLPPREKVADPQQALMQALSRAQAPAPVKKSGPCDKCDGPHHADDCPHFKKKRSKHKDAQDKYGKGGDDSSDSEKVVLKKARVITQPGDGSCLFHSLAYGLRGLSATQLRADVADFIAAHPEAEVAGNPIKDWVLWDAGTDVKSYARTMRTGSRWGGAVEIAVCAQLKRVAVHVYEKGRQGFTRISTFGDPSPSGQIVNVHYGGRVHYDALQV